MLVDTDVLIWHLRGLREATRRLDQLPDLAISTVTYLELLLGMRSKAEMLLVQRSLERRHAERLPLNPAITGPAVALMEALALSNDRQSGDALIAATALVRRHINCEAGLPCSCRSELAREFDDSRASSLPRPTVSIPLEGKVLLEDKALRRRC